MTGSLTWAALANLAKIAAASESSSRDEADDRLGRVAVMRGYLGALELQDVRGGRPKAWLGDLLVRAGWLSPDQLLALLETLKPDWTACWRCRAEVVASLCGPCVEAVKALAVDEPKSLGKYEIVRKIGSGGMGSVYEAIDPQLNRKVALKLLHAGEGADHRLIERFRREAQNAARLQHSNIVTVYEAGEAGRTSYIAMELVDGVPLSVWRARERPSLREAVRVIEEAARAVQAAHDKGIIHRDLKPANILVDRHGRPHLLDFGLSHAMDTDHGMTRPGTILGTPLYMPPEQVRGDVRQMDARSDVYALGAVLYEVLTGRPPFQEASAIEIYTKILTHEATPPRRIDKTVPRDLETVALRALEKDPERRYATAGALADDLHRWSEDEPIEARPVSRIERLVRKAVRYRAILLPSSAALIVGLLVGILGLSSLKKNGRLGDDVSALPPLVEGHGVGWKLSFTINDRVVYPELVNGVWRHEAITARVVDERFVLEGEGPISEVRWLARADFPSNAQLIVIGHAGENLTARLPIQSNGMAVIGDVLVGFATSETGYNRVRARSGQVELSSSLGRYLLESGRTLVLDRLWIARGKPEELLARYAERWMVQSAGPPRGWDSWHAGG
ncbi:MAG: serine/threonine protein kinase [Planctomycetes bacterium]|nr:serine/threonine protein kinase [Planctomycetota bacterium]